MAFLFGRSSSAHAAAGPQWYYYLQNDPRRQLPDGWYQYESAVNNNVEQLYQNNGGIGRHLLPMTASSGFQYEIDFTRLVQRNATSGTERPISRTSNGLSPDQQTTTTSTYAATTSTATATATPTASSNTTTDSNNKRRNNIHARRQYSHATGEVLTYTAPERLHEIHLDEKKVFVNVEPLSKEEEKKQTDRDCAICLDALWETDGSAQQQQRVVALKGCSHEFHYQCIQSSLTNSSTKCPLCSKPIQHHEDNQTAKGRCPSGTMTTSVLLNMTCDGFAPGTIQIGYNIPSSTQKSYHPHPGVPFSGASRVAYLPNNHLGQHLLARMQYAFCHGLSFMVGTSLTTAQPNVVTWASIHHKTSLSGGTQSFGFPDESYFTRCNGELDGLGVPDAAACQKWLQNLPG